MGTLIIIYLDVVLLIGRKAEEIQVGQDTLIILLQELGYLMKQEKSAMVPVQEIKFLGMITNSKEMTFHGDDLRK